VKKEEKFSIFCVFVFCARIASRGILYFVFSSSLVFARSFIFLHNVHVSSAFSSRITVFYHYARIAVKFQSYLREDVKKEENYGLLISRQKVSVDLVDS
jgi:GT2 family glycosyltransferase